MDVRADRELQQLFSAKKLVGLDTPLQWRKAEVHDEPIGQYIVPRHYGRSNSPRLLWCACVFYAGAVRRAVGDKL